MNNAMKLNEGNKKREAFKRFSQMGVAGLAVCSMSAFTDVAAQEQPDTTKNNTIKERTVPLFTEPVDTVEVHRHNEYVEVYNNYLCVAYTDFYSAYSAYSVYSNNVYSNHYADNCD
jgi:hypothetical protein